jgi:hypothetical protein
VDAILLWPDKRWSGGNHDQAAATTTTADAGWFHVDQNPRPKPQQQCVQGLLNSIPVTPETGGNALLVQSHIEFEKEYNLNFNNHNNHPLSHSCADFYHQRLEELTPNDDSMEIDPDRVVTVVVNEGDLLLWDSCVANCLYLPAPTTAAMTVPGSKNTVSRYKNPSVFIVNGTVPSCITSIHYASFLDCYCKWKG